MVTSLNQACSPLRRQGIRLFWPMTRFGVIATIAFIRIRSSGVRSSEGSSRLRVKSHRCALVKLVQNYWEIHGQLNRAWSLFS